MQIKLLQESEEVVLNFMHKTFMDLVEGEVLPDKATMEEKKTLCRAWWQRQKWLRSLDIGALLMLHCRLLNHVVSQSEDTMGGSMGDIEVGSGQGAQVLLAHSGHLSGMAPFMSHVLAADGTLTGPQALADGLHLKVQSSSHNDLEVHNSAALHVADCYQEG
eukprot:6473175-Amphidinium_carterae.2